MHHVVAKFLPFLHSEDQKKNCADVSKQLVNHANADEKFLKNVETKALSLQWV
jgi:hypothetical protein